MMPTKAELRAVSRLNPEVSTGQYFAALKLAAYSKTRRAYGLTPRAERAIAALRVRQGKASTEQPPSIRHMLDELRDEGLATLAVCEVSRRLGWHLTHAGEELAALARGESTTRATFHAAIPAVSDLIAHAFARAFGGSR